MKKLISMLVTAALAVTSVFALAGCNSANGGNGGGILDVVFAENSKNVFAGSQSSEPSTCIMVSEWMTPPSTRIDTHSRSAGPR